MKKAGVLCAILTLLGISCSIVEPTSAGSYAYDNLIFEIAPTPGTAPSESALLEFSDLLEYYGFCNQKYIGFVVQQEKDCDAPAVWQLSYIQNMELRRRSLVDSNINDRTGVIFVSYVFGSYMDGHVHKKIAGLQYSSSSFAMFRSSLQNCEPQLLLHEFCHMFGLLKDKTEDPKFHCPDESCIMHPIVMSPNSMLCNNCETLLRKKIAKRK